VQFVNPPPTLFIFPAVPVGCATVRFLLYRVDLFLNECGEFVSDPLRVS
jgi:hypothetical protein